MNITVARRCPPSVLSPPFNSWAAFQAVQSLSGDLALRWRTFYAVLSATVTPSTRLHGNATACDEARGVRAGEVIDAHGANDMSNVR